MDTERRQELISAYLDGEVTAEERRTVEALLAESDEARQLLEELRGLQTRVRQLPRLSLGADFSQTVLDEAEQRMISGAGAGVAADVAAADDNGDDTNGSGETADDHDLHVYYAEQDRVDRAAAWKRRIVWSVLAVAAALLIMVVFPEKDPQNVARHDREAGDAASKAPIDAVSTDQAIEDEVEKSGRTASISAADEAAEVPHDRLAPATTERKAPQAAAVERKSATSPEKAADLLPQDGAAADSAGQAPAGGVARRAGDPVNQAATGSGRPPVGLRVAAEAEQLQIAAGYDGVAVFELDQQSFVSVNGLRSARDTKAPTAEAGPQFRPVPKDELADRRDAPLADEADADGAKAEGDSKEQVYWGIVEGTAEEIQLALAELQTPATHYEAIEMKPQLATRLKTFGGGGAGGGIAGVVAGTFGGAKQQPASPDAVGPIADAESPATGAIAAAPSKPKPAPETPPSAAKKLDDADAQDKRRQVNGAAEVSANRDRTKSASTPAPAPPAATAAATETDGFAAETSPEQPEELAKRVIRALGRSELRSRQAAQRELQGPRSEAATLAENESANKEEDKPAEEVDGKQASKTTEKQTPAPASPQPAPVAEPAAELPLLKQSKLKDAGAETTYRVLVVVRVK